MAHLTFEYSKDLSNCFEVQELCDELSDAMRETSYFPVGGIRVRGLAADVSSIADRKAKYSFVDMVLRMGEGRSEDVRKNIGLKTNVASETKSKWLNRISKSMYWELEYNLT